RRGSGPPLAVVPAAGPSSPRPPPVALTSRLWKPNLSAVAGRSNASMQLLVSVADAREARAARLGGADVIDAKNPHRGALGAVSEATLRAIRAAAGRPFSAALGDAGGTAMLARRTRIAAQLGAAYVKVGFRDVLTTAGVRARVVAALGATAVRPGTHVVLVAYADWSRAGRAAPPVVLEVAAATGAAGVLLDTAYKDATLFALWSPEMVGARGRAAPGRPGVAPARAGPGRGR